MTEAGFAIRPGEHPIVPIMLGDAAPRRTAWRPTCWSEGIYVVGFSYPVVPQGQARIRVQISAAHEPAHLERAVAAFVKVGRALGSAALSSILGRRRATGYVAGSLLYPTTRVRSLSLPSDRVREAERLAKQEGRTRQRS